ncbi:MAG TPA: BtrH N-terminal domain-containing protein [Solirubrobacterales bacterium]|nr:BtrH N-terminal domain-containing protein [Solirubrobacterales bacterium]
MPSVPGYVHTPGNHCGSTALRNLLAFHGIELSEEMAFGLGAGASFYYLTLEDGSPTRWFNGRTARLEETFRDLTGAALEMRTFAPGDDGAWEAARAEVDAGSPALLLTDIYYLDYYGNSAHFPGHAVVLAGYDDEVAHLSDTSFEQLQQTRLENLDKARHSDHPAYQLQGHMFTVAAVVDREQLLAAIPGAIEQTAKEMVEPTFGEFAGLPAVDRLAAEAGSWPEVAEDWQWCARFAYQVIERRGTGGGAFRLMYSRFLEEAGWEEAPLAAAAAARWTELAEAFKAASESDKPTATLWGDVGSSAAAVARSERRLWESLYEASEED